MKTRRKTRTKIKAHGKTDAQMAHQAERRAVAQHLDYVARHDDRMEEEDGEG